MSEINNLINKYNDFYIERNFNIDPIVWKQDSDYITSSFNNSFRGENAYVWQERSGDNKEKYLAYYKIIQSIDKDNLLSKTFECGSHGCISYDVDNIKISRDLLDSILEIYFLKWCFKNLSNLSLLEIGAGYGRLCKRYLDCYPQSKYYITDGIPQSTFFSKIYLKENIDSVINLYDIEEKIKSLSIDVAVNVHSFPECHINDIEWWINLINSNKIRYIFYVPNEPTSTSQFMPSNSGESILDLFNKYNYAVKYSKNMYSELNINYSYSVPFFLLENAQYVANTPLKVSEN
jgi:putative sugar O-methyltransferase